MNIRPEYIPDLQHGLGHQRECIVQFRERPSPLAEWCANYMEAYTYYGQNGVKMAFPSTKNGTRLLLVGRVETPYSNGVIC